MGTVGLNFGSPTSGTGFNVSSTVAEIMSNLENVETPWKNQLTSLDGQDTAISSLGTLLSSVSTDMSQLTDFDGVLAQKEGSSSDTNVLELTGATSSAAAGTHSVVVHNLAATSSGYLAEVASSSETLSGSITLKVGNGTAQTITLDSSDNTLTGLAGAINSSNVGISANVLTDATGSRLSLVSATPGANGNIVVTGNSISAAASNTLGATVTAGSGTGSGSTTSTALLAAVASASETLSSTGTLSVTVGSGSAQNISMSAVNTAEGGTTLTNLKNYINDPANSFGFTASIVNNSDGTVSLQLTSGTTGSTGTLAVSSSVADPATALAYTSTVAGANANLTVDGVNLTSTSNTVSGLIPGVSFQLLAPSASESDGSLEQVQVVISNDNTGVESAVNQFVSDYNSLISAVNAQEGLTSSGSAEPLFGSPTLSLLQQELLNNIDAENPNGYLDSVSATAGATLTGSITIHVGSNTKATFEIGSGTSGNGTYYTGSGSGFNTLAGLAATINATTADTPVAYAAGSSSDTGSLTAANTSQFTGAAPELGGELTIQVGGGTAQTVSMDDVSAAEGGTTLADIATYITSQSSTLGVTASVADNGNGTSTLTLSSASLSGDALTIVSGLAIPGSGVSAGVVTKAGQSSLTLTSQTSGSSGALAVTSSIEASTPTALSYTDSGYTSTTGDNGTLGTVPNSSDTLSGSITVQVGSNSGNAQTIDMSTVNAEEGGTTLGDLQQYIYDNSSTLGFTAAMVNNNDGSQSLTLTSNTVGSTGVLTVTPSLYDTSSPTTSSLGYTNSSDINSLTTLGISVNNDGSLTFDANSLDSILNTDYASVAGFFQNTDGWGQGFSNMLTNAGSSTSTGILGLAKTANSTTESVLNGEITKEQSYISAQQSSLTTELNQANQIMQQLPSQLQGINELYSAVTGYNQGTSGG
jgi:flagellar hook-associated protein 2